MKMQLVDRLPTESTDRPVDMIVTEDRIINTGNGRFDWP